MRPVFLASVVLLALGAAADSAPGGWRTYRTTNRTSRLFLGQKQADWRTYGVANKTSPDGAWTRGYGRMGYGWYSVYGDYVGSDYSSIGFGYRNRAAGFNFNRTENYGFTDPRDIGDRAR